MNKSELIEHIAKQGDIPKAHATRAQLAEAQKDAEPAAQQWDDIAVRVCRSVAELPDRDSPKGWPEAMLVTHEELHAIVLGALNDDQPTPQTADVGEAVAFAHFAENGNIRLWAPERPRDLAGNAAQPLYTAGQLAAAVAAERERLSRFGVELGRLAKQIDADADASATGAEMRMVRQTSHRVENLALRFAAAIRAGAKEPSDAICTMTGTTMRPTATPPAKRS